MTKPKNSNVTKSRGITAVWEYLQLVDALEGEWNRKEGSSFQKWFRGQGDSKWGLVPSLYRKEYKGLGEDTCRAQFALRAYPYLVSSAREPTTDWDWYFLMQHHGLPTRLLDWTESPLVALYFALREAEPGRDAAVWMLDPWMLNDVAGLGNQMMFSADPEAKPYLPECYSAGIPPEAPMAITPPHHSRRLTAQKGTFTLHGSSRDAIEANPKLDSRLQKIVLDGQNTKKLRRELARTGITETSVFPELPGLCRELLEYWSGR